MTAQITYPSQLRSDLSRPVQPTSHVQVLVLGGLPPQRTKWFPHDDGEKNATPSSSWRPRETKIPGRKKAAQGCLRRSVD